jgi:hypothetical protein
LRGAVMELNGVLAVVAVIHPAGVAVVRAGRALADPVVSNPTAAGAPGAAFAQTLINWLGQYGLWACLAAMLVGGAIYGFATFGGNGFQAAKGRTVALAGLVGAVIIGLAPIAVNLLFGAASKG